MKIMLIKLFSFLILLLILPIILLSMFLIIIIDKQNPFFIQKRIGLNNKIFKIIKLRTMKHNKITHLGSYLRKYSIDELPQFINIILGEMTLIGPRPLINDNYTKQKYYNRTKILPGLTGYHQVFGKTNTNKERYKMDMHYINNKNIILDIKIIIKTIINTIMNYKINP